MYSFFACLNRCQAKGENYDTSWKMITRRETYLVILIITISSFSAFHCPTNTTCVCDLNYDGAFELNCLMKNDSYFIVNIQPNQYIKVRIYLILHLSRHSCKDILIILSTITIYTQEHKIVKER